MTSRDSRCIIWYNKLEFAVVIAVDLKDVVKIIFNSMPFADITAVKVRSVIYLRHFDPMIFQSLEQAFESMLCKLKWMNLSLNIFRPNKIMIR